MKTALILTDFSDAAQHAANYIAHISSSLGLKKLIVLNAIPPVSSIPRSPMILRSQAEELFDAELHIKGELARIQKLLPEDVELEHEIAETLIGEDINKVSEKLGVELIVMGMIGKSKAEQVFIGSNTLRVVDVSNVPVLVVPKNAAIVDLQRILLATDLKDMETQLPISLIRGISQLSNAEVLIVNVDTDPYDYKNDDREEMRALRDKLKGVSVKYEYAVHDDAVKGILQAAKEIQASMIISMPKERSFFNDLFHSSVTKKLAYTSDYPLLLVKNGNG